MSFSLQAADLVVDITSPQNGSSINLPYSMSGSAIDSDSVRAVKLAIRSLDTNQYWNGSNFQASYTRVSAQISGPNDDQIWVYTDVPDLVGKYSVIAWVWNDAYQSSSSSSLWYTVIEPVDNQAPTVSFADLVSGSTFTSLVELTGAATDNVAIASVDVAIRNVSQGKYWNGSAFQSQFVRVGTQLSGSDQSISWSYDNFPDVAGSYSVSARARDEAGNVASPSTAWFTYAAGIQDTTPPTTTFLEPSTTGLTLAAPYELRGSVVDDVEIDRVRLAIYHKGQNKYWNGTSLVTGYTRVPAALTGSALQGLWELDNLPEADGDYTVAVWSWDASQNYGSPSLSRFTLGGTASDTESATVEFSTSVSATEVESPVALSGTAADNVDVDRVELTVRNNDTGLFWNGSTFQAAYVRLPTELSGSGANVDWSYSNFPTIAGGYALGAWVWDANQNDPGSSNTWLRVAADDPAPPGVNITNYDLVFSDEFNAFSLDPNKWDTSLYWGPYKTINAEEQFYVDTLGLHADADFSPFEFTGESLIISAVKTSANLMPPNQPPENDPLWDIDPDKSYTQDFDPSDANYLSGIITSASDFNFTHGYVEARVKLPVGRGLWPAFWLLNTKYVEDSPEIDIMEFLGQDSDRVYHTYHYFDVANSWEKISSPTYETQVANLTEYHTFGMAWEADQLIWFVDGVETQRVTDANLSISKQSMYVIANMAVGGAWPGSPDANTEFPAEYELDYIRVYQKKPVTPVTPAVLQSEYQLMFSDEFNSATLDSSKWNTSFLWGPYFPINNEEQLYIDEFGHHSDFPTSPFSIDNGVLNIRAEPISSNQLPDQPANGSTEWLSYPSQQYNALYQQSNGWTPSYTSGLLTSYDSFKFVHGYVEMRAKVPEGDGLWPAFWLLNGYYVGPQPEIDIMELKGEEPDVVHHSYHFSGNNGVLNSSAELYSLPNGESFSDDFHTYGVEWGAGTIKWYVDGVVTRTMNSSDASTQLMYIIVNLAVGGNFVGPVGPDVTPADFSIDYIRAYQRKSTP